MQFKSARILNSKRSSMEPYRANVLSVYNNYSKFLPASRAAAMSTTAYRYLQH